MNRPEKSFGTLVTASGTAADTLIHLHGWGWYREDFDLTWKRDQFYGSLVVRVLAGTAIYRQRGRQFRVEADQALVLSLLEGYEQWPDPQSGCEMIWLHFDGAGCETLVARLSHLGPLRVPAVSSCDDILDGVLDLASSETLGLGGEIAISVGLYRLLAEFLAIHAGSEEFDPLDLTEHPLVARVHDFLRIHYREKITLEALSTHMHLSPHYFNRAFKKQTGVSPVRYAMKYKIEKSKFLIQYTQQSMKEIAEFLSFADQSHFYRVFRDWEGVSPTGFRARHESG